MSNIYKAIEFLRGKKSYVVGVLTIVLGYLNGDNAMIMSGLGIITLRAGMKK